MDKTDGQEVKCFGSTVVGPRGQLVIPVHARKELSIDTGDTLLVFQSLGKRGLLLLKADAVEQLISTAGEWLSSVEKQLKRTASAKATQGRG